MKLSKRKRLSDAGWQVGAAGEFLGLTPEEAAFVEIRLALGAQVRTARARSGLTQAALAAKLGSSQSRIAKAEAGDPTVSLDPRLAEARDRRVATSRRPSAL
jgi:DNA-binding XRE family transcriptional regulator